MAHVTIDRIAVVQAHIAETVTRTTPNSTLTVTQQDQLLAQSCAEACDLLVDWLKDPWWVRDLASGDKPIGEFLPSQVEFSKFLGPMLKDVLDRATGVSMDDSLVDDAYKKVAAAARRFPRMKRTDLLEASRYRVEKLQQEVCRIAADIRAGKKPDPALMRKAQKVLKAVRGQLVAVVLAMLAAGPMAMAHNAVNWGEPAVHAAEVIAVHYVAAQAQPNLVVSPHHAGPRVR